jgi:DNA-binding protein YbaB
MTLNLESLSKGLFDSEMDKIPEPYRTKFLDMVKKSQDNLESKTYPGTAGAGLLTITVSSQGLIKKLDIDKSLVQKRIDNNAEYADFNQLISDLCVVAHADAVTNVKKGLDEELVKLYSQILSLTNELLANKK